MSIRRIGKAYSTSLLNVVFRLLSKIPLGKSALERKCVKSKGPRPETIKRC